MLDDHENRTKMLNARQKIVEALLINIEVKRAMKKRIKQDAVRASMVVAKAIRKFRKLREVRRNK